MFGGIGNLANVLKQAGQMKENMAKMQEELAKMTYAADAGAGLVRVTVNGRSELVDIKIEPKAVEDVELLEDLIKGAVSAASRKAQEGMKEELAKLTGGLSIPGLEDMLGGGST